MKGLLFIQITPGAQPQAFNVKIGSVKDVLPGERFLLEFNGPKFSFMGVVPVQELGSYMFFANEGERQACLASLMPPQAPAEIHVTDPTPPTPVSDATQ